MRPTNDIRVLLLEREVDHYNNHSCMHGRLFINGVYFCDTIENKAKLIPEGIYKVDYCDSSKFKRQLPLIYNETDVQASRGIRIHAGNSANDSAGCIIVGEEYFTRGGLYGDGVRNSKVVLESLCRIFDRDDPRYINQRTILIISER